MGLSREFFPFLIFPSSLKTRGCQQLHIERVCKPFKPSLSRQKFHKYFNYFTTPKHRRHHHRRAYSLSGNGNGNGEWERSPGQVGSVLMEFMQPVPAVPPSPSPTKPPCLLRKLSLYRVSIPPPPWRDWVRCGWKGWARCGVSVGKCSLTYFSRS